MTYPYVITREEAIGRLTRNWERQVARFPTTARDIPLTLYIQRNISSVRTGDLLKEQTIDGERSPD